MVNHPNRSKTLKFKRATSRRWLGNGFSYQPASYVIEYLGEICGSISYNAHLEWSLKFAPLNWVGEFTCSYPRLEDAKKALQNEIARRNAAQSAR